MKNRHPFANRTSHYTQANILFKDVNIFFSLKETAISLHLSIMIVLKIKS